MKQMAVYVQSKGGDLGDSSKPGAKLSHLLRRREDVFGYDDNTEEYFLVSANDGGAAKDRAAEDVRNKGADNQKAAEEPVGASNLAAFDSATKGEFNDLIA